MVRLQLLPGWLADVLIEKALCLALLLVTPVRMGQVSVPCRRCIISSGPWQVDAAGPLGLGQISMKRLSSWRWCSGRGSSLLCMRHVVAEPC